MIAAIVNQKGGTAKTTTVLNLAVALAEMDQKVMAIDMDTQGNLTYSFGFMNLDKTIADVFHEDARWEDTLLKIEGIDLMPADVNLADVELAMSEADERAFYLKEILKPHQDEYDWIFIDCPPSLSTLTLNALAAVEKVIIPMQLEVLSLQGLELIVKTISKVSKAYNAELSILGILPVMVDYRRKLSMEVLEHIRENYEMPIFESRIRTNVKASEAPSFGQSVLTYAPRSNAATDYIRLAKEMMQLNK